MTAQIQQMMMMMRMKCLMKEQQHQMHCSFQIGMLQEQDQTMCVLAVHLLMMVMMMMMPLFQMEKKQQEDLNEFQLKTMKVMEDTWQ